MTEKQGGVPLPPGEVHIYYDPQSIPESTQQPQSQQVAVFEAKPNECNGGKMLDTNQHFVVYAVKNGLIRILHRQSSVRALLRAHEGKTVTDIEFFGNGDVLGTVGANVVVWRVYERNQEVVAEKLLEIPETLPGVSRLIWHPFNPNQFWLIHRNRDGINVATLVETTRIKTVAHPTESHAVCQLHSEDVVMKGATQLAATNLTDLEWSVRDARHVMTAHEDGSVKLWDIKADTTPTANGVFPAVCKATFQAGTGPITRCLFLIHDNVATNYGDTPDSTITNAFVSASHGNSCITIWSPFTNTGTPTKLQVFQMDQANPSYNLGVCFGPLNNGGEPPAYFLLLSDRNEGKMFAVALKSIWSSYEPKRPLVEGFEYLVPFLSKFPTYSWSITACEAETLDENAPVGGLNFDMKFFALKSKMVQQMTIPHYMCLPPTSLWESDTRGVRMEPLARPSANGIVQEHVYEEDYELDDVDEDDDDDEDYEAPDPSSLPQPDVMGTLGGGNPFANWLGAIAAKNPSDVGPPPKPKSLPPPAPPSTPSTGVVVNAPPGLLAAVPSPLDGTGSRSGSGLLSPLEILSGGSTTNDSTPQPAEKQANITKKSKSPRRRSPNRRGNSPSRKGNQKKNTPNFPAGPVPSADGKIVILKRETESSVAPAATAAAAPIPANIEESMRKMLTTHFKNQEKVLANEIQRAVRSEIKQTVLPELSKTVAQTVEQSVVKPLQSSMDKFATKVPAIKTEKVAEAVTKGVEEPLKEAFTESMKTMMIPAFEAATKQMFSQFATSLEGRAAPAQANNEMNAKIDALTAMVQALSLEVSNLRKAASGSSPPSKPPQPPQQVDQIQRMRSEILAALQIGNYEVAFTKALSASTAEMAVFCCRNSNLENVLGGNKPALSQPILLCLMQQLGAVLVTSTEADLATELAWLQEIALTLDTSDESIQRHVPSVLQQLGSSISAKMQQGDPALRRPLQMLLQVIRGMQR